MHNEIVIFLIDYKNHFGSKWNASPYRSGMDKDILCKYCKRYNYKPKFINFSEAIESCNLSENPIIVYTSSEDHGLMYKSYIEDIVLGLEQKGMKIIPGYNFLRANNNKVYMEILRKRIFSEEIRNLKTTFHGTLEEVNFNEQIYPVVVKKASGAMSRGVELAMKQDDLTKIIQMFSFPQDIKKNFKDKLRSMKHKNYIRESKYRYKFILQEYIPNLKSDYKVLIFGDRYYIFERPVREKDFRASGSGNKNYIYGSNVVYPLGIFDFSRKVFNLAKVPNISIDIAFDGNDFYLLEFQALYFGTVGHAKSDGYYTFQKGSWEFINKILDIEQVYIDSIHNFSKTII